MKIVKRELDPKYFTATKVTGNIDEDKSSDTIIEDAEKQLH